MSSSSLMSYFFQAVGFFILYGIFIPALISAKDTFSVCLGFFIIAITVLGFLLYINSLFNVKKQTPIKTKEKK